MTKQLSSWFTLLLILCSFCVQGKELGHKQKSRKYDLLVAEALKYQGTKYVFGGCTPGGFDCSGFIQFIFHKFNIELPRTSINQSKSGKHIGLKKVKKGDLIFFRGSNIKDRKIGHVGIVISERGQPIRFIHASTSRGVVVSNLSSTYYKERFRRATCFKELKKKV